MRLALYFNRILVGETASEAGSAPLGGWYASLTADGYRNAETTFTVNQFDLRSRGDYVKGDGGTTPSQTALPLQ